MATTRRTSRMLLVHLVRLGAALALAGFALLSAPPAARANGVPIRFPLGYLSGLSNFGAPDASGEAELSFAEAILKVDVRGMTPLRGESYALWLVKSSTNKAVAVGALTVNPGGTAGFTGKITGLDGYDYDLLIITVEPRPDADPAPSTKRSIGGFFTPIKKTEQASAGIASDTQPATLPNTGDVVPVATTSNRRPAAMALFALGGLSLYVTMRRRRNA